MPHQFSAAPLEPAEPARADDGTPYSARYDDIYHAAQGGLAQARHVFLSGNELPARWAAAGDFVVAETGFGLGLNFLATWHAWRESRASGRLHFVAAEKHPFRHRDLAGLLAPHAELAPLADQLLEQWPSLTPGYHYREFDCGAVALTLFFGDALSLVRQGTSAFDAIYLDGFTPRKNPELWSPELFAALTRQCRDRATLATWSVAGEVRRALAQAGWQVERRPGFGRKREMLVGHLDKRPAPEISPDEASL